MRAMVLASLLIGFAGLCGCGGKTDPTMNRMNMMGAQNYPPGPYGYAQGTVIENINFLAKADPAGASGSADYAQLPLQALSLADLHNDPSVKLIVLSGVAGWCGPCNQEQSEVPADQAKYEPMGVKFLEGMVQGYDEQSGAPATEADINKWALLHNLHVALGLDPEDKLHQYADIAAFPLNLMIRTSDMQIVYMQTGVPPGGLDPIIEQNLPQ